MPMGRFDPSSQDHWGMVRRWNGPSIRARRARIPSRPSLARAKVLPTARRTMTGTCTEIVETYYSKEFSSRPPAGEDQHKPRRQADKTDDRIEHNRVRLRYFNSEEAHVRHALRGEVGDAGNRQGDDAENDEEQSHHREWSHHSCLLKRALPP